MTVFIYQPIILNGLEVMIRENLAGLLRNKALTNTIGCYMEGTTIQSAYRREL